MSQQRDYKNSFESRQRAALSALVLLVALVLWFVVSRGFVIYLANFNTYNRVYGSIGAVVILLIQLEGGWFKLPLPHQLLVEISTLLAGLILVKIWGILLFEFLLPLCHVRIPRIIADIVITIGYIGWGLFRLYASGMALGEIVTTSAVITAVIAFAMQDTLGNLLGGLALLGLELLHVPYKGSADLMQSILGGQIMAAADSTGFAPQVEAGKLRVLNTWGAERLAKFPDAPTLKELGLDLVQNSPFGIGAPKGTPPEVVKRLHDAFKQAMEQDSYRTALARYDMVPMYMGTAAYQKFAQETFNREKALVEKLGLARPQ